MSELFRFDSEWWKYARPSSHAETSERQLTTNSSDNPIIGAAISGDGKYQTFGDNFGLHVRSLESGETRDIPNPEQFGDAHVFWSISWFPDSTRFLAVSNPFDTRMITWQASVMGGALHKVRDDMRAWSVSPDGSSVAATKAVGHPVWLIRELWVMDTDGGHPRKLLEVGERACRLQCHVYPPIVAYNGRVSIKEIQTLTGHKTITMAALYARLPTLSTLT